MYSIPKSGVGRRIGRGSAGIDLGPPASPRTRRRADTRPRPERDPPDPAGEPTPALGQSATLPTPPALSALSGPTERQTLAWESLANSAWTMASWASSSALACLGDHLPRTR